VTSTAASRLVALLLAIAGTTTAARAADLENLPGFDLPLLDGGYINAVDLVGHVAIVDFWAAWCAPCADAMPAYEELFQTYGAQGLRVVAINMDESEDAARAFLAKHPVTYAIARDPLGEVAASFAMRGMPSAYLIACDGTVRAEYMSYRASVADGIRAQLEVLLKEPACGVTEPVDDAP
jgi:cytochrome c biogenesis protein CcmG, thiol:disulfide interchange protein DsbE